MGTLDIRDIVQAVIALIIVIGAFLVMAFLPNNPNLPFITTIAGMCIGYYFQRIQKASSGSRHEE
jgi:hydrogenase/urease accessory protein HupE